MKILLFFAFLCVVGMIIPVSAQNLPKDQNFVDAVNDAKECRKKVMENPDLSEAQKIVERRNCSTESSKKIIGNVEAKPTRLTELRIKNAIQCESWYDNYQIATEANFKIMKPSQLVEDCIVLYNDEIWQYSGKDRLQKILERADELDLFKIAKIKAKLPTMVSPLKQIEQGIPKTHVDCKDNYVLIFKMDSKNPACFSLGSAEKIIIRGWGSLVP